MEIFEALLLTPCSPQPGCVSSGGRVSPTESLAYVGGEVGGEVETTAYYLLSYSLVMFICTPVQRGPFYSTHADCEINGL